MTTASNYRGLKCAVLVCFVFFGISTGVSEREIREFVDKYDKDLQHTRAEFMSAGWDYYTNMTQYNQDIMTQRQFDLTDFRQKGAKQAMQFDLDSIQNTTLKRMMSKILDVGLSGYENRTVLERINDLSIKMITLYSVAEWCPTPDKCLLMEPDLVDKISTSRDWDELTTVWKGWRDVSGKQMRSDYLEYVRLKNMAISHDGRYNDIGEYYRSWYESPTFEEDVKELFVVLEPLYEELHAYVRYKLRQHYGKDRFPETGHIPAQILGNMWAQKWTNIYDLLEPYPMEKKKSLTEEMVDMEFTVERMYKMAEDMFVSIGLGPMPASFWNNSMLVAPTDGRNVVCHASAWDMYNGTDFRIKQCTTVTMDQFAAVQHEMGHLIYDNEYWRQPMLFRDGANPGFHEGFASLIILSFNTPENKKRIGLIKSLPQGQEEDINVLLQMALDNVAFLPFGYLIDQWRWSLYRGEYNQSNYNSAWWDLRCGYQGVSPPVERSETDFDAASKYHIPGNSPYIRYFVMALAQFQWHDALCEIIGHTGPLHRCNIYGHKAAGDRLREMLSLGASRPWGEAMRTLTRGTKAETNKLSAASLLKYFKPLQDWLHTTNKRNGEKIGWNRSKCPNIRYGPVSAGRGNILKSNIYIYISVIAILTLLHC